jgi:hypothetical protein
MTGVLETAFQSDLGNVKPVATAVVEQPFGLID